jgi:hypothetical protein
VKKKININFYCSGSKKGEMCQICPDFLLPFFCSFSSASSIDDGILLQFGLVVHFLGFFLTHFKGQFGIFGG